MRQEYVIYGAADMTIHRSVVADRNTAARPAAGERVTILRYPLSGPERCFLLQLLGIKP